MTATLGEANSLTLPLTIVSTRDSGAALPRQAFRGRAV
jgi:hypothetical protein